MQHPLYVIDIGFEIFLYHGTNIDTIRHIYNDMEVDIDVYDETMQITNSENEIIQKVFKNISYEIDVEQELIPDIKNCLNRLKQYQEYILKKLYHSMLIILML